MEEPERSAGADIRVETETCDADDTTCSVCYAEFLDPEDLEVHIQQVHPSRSQVHCQFCDESYPDAETYVLHIRDVHLLDFKSCWVCSRVFTHYSQLRKHETKHPRSMREGSFSCSQCKQFFLYKSELQQHELDNHHDTREGGFLNKYYSLLSSVINFKAQKFIQSITNVSEGKEFVYVCNCCKHRNTDLEAYILHLRDNYCRSLVCDRCCRVYNSKKGLVAHVSQHPNCNIKEAPSSMKAVKLKRCPKCKEYLNQKRNHNCNPILKCTHCDTDFKTMYELSEHQINMHPLAVSLVTCKFCRRECVGTVALDKHIKRTHSHEFHLYKYTCSYCNTTFKHPKSLFAHYFLKHKDIEPYLCKICDKKFRLRKPFTLHIKLEHKSKGFVEFDENLHVFFSAKKSENPFQPVSIYIQEDTSDKDDKDTTIEVNTNKSQDLDVVALDTDSNANETEGNQTDVKENVRKRRKTRKTEVDQVTLSDCDSDDEPLQVIKKKAKLKSQLRKKPNQWKKRSRKGNKKFTCDVCQKYCYTFQNYHNHISMHFKDESKKCVKCTLAFKSKADLQRHMTEEHSSSKLTETLKNIIERRKKGEQKQELSTTEKFLKTIKKVQSVKDTVTATLSPITKELSVQKFIESFTPEVSEAKSVLVKNNISIIKVTNPVVKEPIIKMTKFKPAPEIIESHVKLAMPVRFKKCNVLHSVSVKKITAEEAQSKTKFIYDNGIQFQDDDDDDNIDNDYSVYNYQQENRDSIPEAEQEVTLEGTEEVPKRNLSSHKIVIPKLPTELKSIRIAHLLPEAPFYKIVKMDDIIKSQQQKQRLDTNENAGTNSTDVRLPDGTKLVHVNPLAHLLGNKPVEEIIQTSNKYSKPKTITNFEVALAKALRKLEDPVRKKVRKKSVGNKNKESPEKDEIDVVREVENTESIEKEAASEQESADVSREEISINDSAENEQMS